ncbi:SEC-C domain-containing protein [Mycoplana sp. MJR14]|uniref:SEC-C domain-containing protein n=1 Tax=Mycoplana sp. MJR14 TaxID=3032583 RepID=UPI0023D9B0A4|nr:SEC-C domain-containing protein [Mycoplana sp. MJR14]MDF1632130.1 SEC-C domain-containing protein [Mycoplana sp. MJR14]
MKGIGRNDLCWCGSGKKYKKCHLDRALQESGNAWDAVEANKKAFHEKRCFARDAGLGSCEGKIIKAHTVSRGPNLTKIAKNGKVVRYNANPAELTKNGGKLTASEVGIGAASVFYGFCAGHDRRLFSCIENEPFIGRPDQCLTVAYRTLSREFYGKHAGSHLRETLRNADRGKPLVEQIKLQNLLELIDQGNELAKKDLQNTHSKLTQALIDGRADVLRSMVIEFERTLPFMFAGAWSPFTDFFGHNLQNGYSDEPLEQIFISSFAGTASQICISWMDQTDAPGQVIADQICKLPLAQQASACLQFAVKHVENVFYDPAWFAALSSEQRKQLDLLAASGVDIKGSVPSAVVRLDLDFELPMVTRAFVVSGDNNGD